MGARPQNRSLRNVSPLVLPAREAITKRGRNRIRRSGYAANNRSLSALHVIKKAGHRTLMLPRPSKSNEPHIEIAQARA